MWISTLLFYITQNTIFLINIYFIEKQLKVWYNIPRGDIKTVERKKKLDVASQVEHMKSKGIKFNIEDEDFAINYLLNNTYYFKLKAYGKLYDKYNTGDNQGQYLNLEFAYLRDLATIDSLLRKKILSVAIDVEHYLKVKLLQDFNKSEENGYDIIEAFKSLNPEHFENEIKNKSYGRACKDLVNKYKNDFAIWNFVEIISFKDFQELYALFYSRNKNLFCTKKDKEKFKGEYYYLITPIRMLRNAAAHNNCLLIDLVKTPDLSFNFEHSVSKFLSGKGIKNTSLNKQLSKPIVHDFCVLLYLYSQIAPKEAQKHTFEDLRALFDTRILKHKEYYKTNSILCSAYEFTKKTIDIFYQLSINN